MIHMVRHSSFYLRRLSSTIHSLYRLISGHAYNPLDSGQEFLSDRDLVLQYGLLSPMAILRGAQTSFFFRLLHKAPPLILSMLQSSAKHVKQIGCVNDLSSDQLWLASGSVLQRQASVNNYIEACKDAPRVYLAKVRKFVTLPFANFDFYEAEICVRPVSIHHWQCVHCHKSFDCYRKLMLHLYQVHDYKDPVRLRIPPSLLHCPICLRCSIAGSGSSTTWDIDLEYVRPIRCSYRRFFRRKMPPLLTVNSPLSFVSPVPRECVCIMLPFQSFKHSAP